MSNIRLAITKSPVDNRDFIYENAEVLGAIAYPLTYDMRSNLRPIRNQGSSSACAAFTASCIKEYQEWKQVQFSEYMSPQFIYNNRENKTSEGMYSRDLMRILNKIGSVEEKRYPFGTRSTISADVYHYALNYRISGYSNILTIDGLKDSLMKNGPALMAIPVYNYGNRMWYGGPGARMLGGHAVTIVGWNETGFILRNSWGTTWGDAGYTTFPYADWGMHWEVWTTIDASSIKNYPAPPKKVVPTPRRILPYIRKITRLIRR